MIADSDYMVGISNYIVQMSKRDDYPAGVPCWVDTMSPDPRAAQRF